MPSKMLIDAAHPEETRVVVVKGNRVEEFDYESANKKQLRGNIYLAKVTRVEPSLQAAFVDYGGNRHGFLAFNEIHPDYYQIPVADRQALLEEEAEEETRASAAEAAQDDAAAGKRRRRRRGRTRSETAQSEDAETDLVEAQEAEEDAEAELEAQEASDEETDFTVIAAENALVHEISEPAPEAEALEDADEGEGFEAESLAEDLLEEEIDQALVIEAEEAERDEADEDETDEADEDELLARETGGRRRGGRRRKAEAGEGEDGIESVGSEDALEEVPERPRRRRRTYKIQEVIRRRQIILVQVVKEERGNKGAALTTYLSLAGRYTVLMPNTARGGGISRKITQAPDRKRLREIAGDLEVPEGMGLIIRTAGAQRTKAEIKRDYDYLLRLWETVRDLTLESTAPSLVYEEGSLIKRSIRDLYNKDIDEVLVAGDDAYREAKDFMRMLMPSHAKNVKPYKEPEPLFIRYRVERQLAAMFGPQVTLKSGGYIVINQTEALVAIDVNSGKATREHSIEDTALKTNLEAAEEIARQLRLRDLAGLIVIDFIDMDERRNGRLVEKRLKDSLRNDRARIQVGRISPFGLLEMSRQRLRTGMLEGSTTPCQICQGTGLVRSIESVALDVLRTIEDKLLTDGVMPLMASTAPEVALYILNQKRAHLEDIERRYRVPIMVMASETLHGAKFTIERMGDTETMGGEQAPVHMDWAHHQPMPSEESGTGGDQRSRRPRRRRRKRRGGEREGEFAETVNGTEPDIGEAEDEVDGVQAARPEAEESESPRRPRRRGRRGGRRSRNRRQDAAAEAVQEGSSDVAGEEQEPSGALEAASAGESSAPALSARSSDDEEAANDTWSGSGDIDGAITEPVAMRAKSGIEPVAHFAPEITDHPAMDAAPPAKAAQEPAFNHSAEVEDRMVADEMRSGSDEDDRAQPRRRGWWQR